LHPDYEIMDEETKTEFMAARKLKTQDLKTLQHLLDYSRYLHEQEEHRNDKLSGVTNTYLVVITFAFTLLLGVISLALPNLEDLLLRLSPGVSTMLLIVAGAAVLLILLSLFFTLLVVKVRPFERLCDSREFVLEASKMKGEAEVISSIISHYVVSTERNFLINNQKARYLSLALQSYLAGFTLLLFTLALLIFSGR